MSALIKELQHAHSQNKLKLAPTLHRVATAKIHYTFVHGHEPTIVIMHTAVRRQILEEDRTYTPFALDMACCSGSFMGMHGYFTTDAERNQIICAR